MGVSGSSAPVCELQPRAHDQVVVSVWRYPLLLVAGITVFCVFLFRHTAGSVLLTWWIDSTYSYGFLIVPIVVFLAWRRRRDLAQIRPGVSLAGMAVLVVAAILWTAGNLGGVLEVQQFALVILLDAAIWALLGTPAVRVLKFPLVFLLFAVPTGGGLVEPLQRLTAEFTVRALRLTGIPAVLEGFVLYIPSGQWEVSQTCSGLRYLTASIVLGVLFAGIAYRGWKRRLAFVVISALVPVVANAIRAYGIVLLGHFSSNRLAAGLDHVIYGWLFFAFITAMLLSVGTRWHEPSTADRTISFSNHAPVARSYSRMLIAAVALAVVLLVNTASGFLWSRPLESTVVMPPLMAGKQWNRVPEAADRDWAPQLGNLKSEVVEAVVSGSSAVSSFAGLYPENGRIELVREYNLVNGSSGWHVGQSQTVPVRIAGRSVVVRQFDLQRGSEARVVRVWYGLGGQLTASVYRLKALSAKCRILGRPQNATVFAVSASYTSNRGDALRALGDFLEQASLPGVVGDTK